MAQAIHCDVHNKEHLADVLVTQLANGDTMAACSEGYLELCRSFVASADYQATDQEARAADDAAVAALEAANPTESAASSDAATAPADNAGLPVDGPPSGGQAQTPVPTEPAPQGRPRRAGKGQAGETATA